MIHTENSGVRSGRVAAEGRVARELKPSLELPLGVRIKSGEKAGCDGVKVIFAEESENEPRRNGIGAHPVIKEVEGDNRTDGAPGNEALPLRE